jgi:hypothetical protein
MLSFASNFLIIPSQVYIHPLVLVETTAGLLLPCLELVLIFLLQRSTDLEMQAKIKRLYICSSVNCQGRHRVSLIFELHFKYQMSLFLVQVLLI